jgi:hypothetical protein
MQKAAKPATRLVRGVDADSEESDGQTASRQGKCSPAVQPSPERHNDQRFRWSGPVWSPPPESNRRPHPYHGTTGNRCAHRRFPRSRPTVEAKVIGSLSTKLCVLPQAMRRSSLGASHNPRSRSRAEHLSPRNPHVYDNRQLRLRLAELSVDVVAHRSARILGRAHHRDVPVGAGNPAPARAEGCLRFSGRPSSGSSLTGSARHPPAHCCWPRW